MKGRPMVNVYEPDHKGVEQLVFRPMNDAEFADWQQVVADAKEAANNPPPNPLVAQVAEMSDTDKAALRAALGVS